MLSIAGASKGVQGAQFAEGANQEHQQGSGEVTGGDESQLTQNENRSGASEQLTPPKSHQPESEINPYAPPETNEPMESVWNNNLVIKHIREQIEYSKDTPATKLLAGVVLCEGAAGALLSSTFSMAGKSLLAAGDTTLFFSFSFILAGALAFAGLESAAILVGRVIGYFREKPISPDNDTLR